EALVRRGSERAAGAVRDARDDVPRALEGVLRVDAREEDSVVGPGLELDDEPVLEVVVPVHADVLDDAGAHGLVRGRRGHAEPSDARGPEPGHEPDPKPDRLLARDERDG